SARRVLLLALGEFGEDRLPRIEREALVPRLLEWYRDDPDPGIHGATDWLLRQWQPQGKGEAIGREVAGGEGEGGGAGEGEGEGEAAVVRERSGADAGNRGAGGVRDATRRQAAEGAGAAPFRAGGPGGDGGGVSPLPQGPRERRKAS